jgi:hypothetical protein
MPIGRIRLTKLDYGEGQRVRPRFLDLIENATIWLIFSFNLQTFSETEYVTSMIKLRWLHPRFWETRLGHASLSWVKITQHKMGL